MYRVRDNDDAWEILIRDGDREVVVAAFYDPPGSPNRPPVLPAGRAEHHARLFAKILEASLDDVRPEQDHEHVWPTHDSPCTVCGRPLLGHRDRPC